MAMISALIFLGATALIVVVVAATLLPALPKIAAALAGDWVLDSPPVTVSRRRPMPRPASARFARPLREAA